MKVIQRSHYQLILTRVKEPRRFIQIVFGPRQVGKTTVIGQAIEAIGLPYQISTADAIPASDGNWLENQWQTARLKMLQSGTDEFILVIDEIQKIDNWSETVKKLWDKDTLEKKNLKVILSGSSRLLIQQGLTESLAGRFETIYMGHWSFKEMNEAFGWNANQYAWFGGYPGPAEMISDEYRWKSYISDSLIETSISKDILMLTRVDKPALMKRLFELGSLYSGQILSLTKIMGQLADAGNTTTLTNYLHLLDTAGLLGGLEKYTKNAIRKRSSSPKFQVHNNAFISAQHSDTFEQVYNKPELWGRVVESAVGAHLLNMSFSERYKVFYWRNGNDEVDFVIEKHGVVVGIEVKSNGIKKTTGMSAFQKLMSPDKMILVGDEGFPWVDFLKINPSDLF